MIINMPSFDCLYLRNVQKSIIFQTNTHYYDLINWWAHKTSGIGLFLIRVQCLLLFVSDTVHTAVLLKMSSSLRSSALIEAFEKAKKKYQAKLKKQESQIQALKTKYEDQVK